VWFVISAFANLIGIGTFVVAVVGFLIYYFTEIPILGPVLIAFALGVFFVLMIGRLRVAGEESDVITIGAWRQDYQPKARPSTSTPNPPEPTKPVRRFGIHWDSEQNPLCPVDDTLLSMSEKGVLQSTGEYFEAFLCPKCKNRYSLRDDKGNRVRITTAKERVRFKI
jgi:hypothetical protein